MTAGLRPPTRTSRTAAVSQRQGPKAARVPRPRKDPAVPSKCSLHGGVCSTVPPPHAQPPDAEPRDQPTSQPQALRASHPDPGPLLLQPPLWSSSSAPQRGACWPKVQASRASRGPRSPVPLSRACWEPCTLGLPSGLQPPATASFPASQANAQLPRLSPGLTSTRDPSPDTYPDPQTHHSHTHSGGPSLDCSLVTRCAPMPQRVHSCTLMGHPLSEPLGSPWP